jgi:hypothetical protein
MSYGPPQPNPYPPAPLPPPAPTRRKGLVIAIIVGAAAFVAVIIVVAINAFSKESSSGPEQAAEASAPSEADLASAPSEADLLSKAQAYVDAVNRRDESAAAKLTCAGTGGGALYDTTISMGGDDDKWQAGKPHVTGATATVDITLAGDDQSHPLALIFNFRDGAWCVTA